MTDVTDSLIVLCGRLREVVLPSLGTHAARGHAGVAVGGDVTFSIDEQAEALLVRHMRERPPSRPFYSAVDGGLQGAADCLLCREAGLPFGDADGGLPDDRPVLGSDAGCQMAGAAPRIQGLQGALVECVQRGIAGLRRPEA